MKKVGILTYHRAHNYGAVLQCYALKEVIKEMGYEVQVIDYRQPEIDENYRYHSFFNLDELSKLPIGRKIQYLAKRILADSYRYLVYLKRELVFSGFRKKYLNLSEKCSNYIIEGYDIYVIGSDMLWDDNCMKGQFDPFYFGDFQHRTGTKIIGYAISGSPASFKRCGDLYKFNFVSNFNALSLRENVLSDFLSSYLTYSVPACLDPTLLTESRMWDGMINKTWSKRKYIVKYYLRVDNEDRERIDKSLAVLAKTRDCEVISINVATNRFPIKVEDFISIIKYADFIVTDSFHGVIFSLIFQRKFNALKLNDSHDARYVDVLNRIGLSQLAIDKESNPQIHEVDYKVIYERLLHLRTDSLRFLRDNL